VPIAIMREFHDRIAATGRMPVGLAEKALMAQA
jgi:hypothetical protein